MPDELLPAAKIKPQFPEAQSSLVWSFVAECLVRQGLKFVVNEIGFRAGVEF